MRPDRSAAPAGRRLIRDVRRIRVLLLVGLLALGGSACTFGTYPLDVFPEMHYQPSKRYLEPERRTVPPGSVPTSRGRPRLTYVQATDLPNPVPQTPETLARAAALYRVNCATCHGAEGRGDGPMAAYYVNNPAAVVGPVDLASPRVQGRTDGQLYWLIANGIGNMPRYGERLSEQDLWAMVTFVRAVP